MPNPEDVEEVAETTEEAAVEPAPETPEVIPQKPTNEMKVVIIMKDDRVMLGVQSPDCDPVYTTMKGSLSAALKKVPALVAEAKQKWEATPRYPKADLPEPAPSPTPARTPVTIQSAKKAEKPSFF
ncbi:hypothetical protein ES703_50639 [subsurface metagenome]